MKLSKFLRYNSRHRLWFPRGYKDKWWPQLNPTESCNFGKDKRKTFSIDEPVWFMRLRRRLFQHVGQQVCPRRGESPFKLPGDKGIDTWDMGPDGNRTCSYCGSIHFDDLMKLCQLAIDDPRYGVDGTDKGYKVYVRQPGVRNASEGAIKYYKMHSPENVTPEQQALFIKALRLTSERFREMLNKH